MGGGSAWSPHSRPGLSQGFFSICPQLSDLDGLNCHCLQYLCRISVSLWGARTQAGA